MRRAAAAALAAALALACSKQTGGGEPTSAAGDDAAARSAGEAEGEGEGENEAEAPAQAGAPHPAAGDAGATAAAQAGAREAADAAAAAAAQPWVVTPVSDALMDKAEAAVRTWFARRAKVAPDRVDVFIDDEGVVPGAVLFRARVKRSRGGGPADREMPAAVGLYTGEVVADADEARAHVARAWKYGPDRTVPASQVARVMGFLEGASGGDARPVYTEGSLKAIHPRYQAVARLPAEVVVDGAPAVEYFVRARDARPSFWKSTVVFRGGGAVEHRREDPLAGGAP
ncbi:MAG TPA: hypothetical protein VKZ63_19000 [Kofleriaceae bacterium]|nr:hypothetical protein [Kofleriaceae bacterium]